MFTLLLVVVLACNVVSPSHAQDDLEIRKEMCQCAADNNICDGFCFDLFDVPGLSPECSNYAALELCSVDGSFPTDVAYKDYCPTIGVPCTASQNMCKCANDFFLCDKFCFELFNVPDLECADYAAIGVCGGEFPSDKTYEEHCPDIGMSCDKTSEDFEIHQEMCRCAQEFDICGGFCFDLFNVPGLSPECSNYAALELCSVDGSFPTDVTYKDYCPTVDTPCLSVSQQMCECAQASNICHETCEYLLNDSNIDCVDYAIEGICGGEFPSDERYYRHCRDIGMTCENVCKDSDSWTTTLDSGLEKGCSWVAQRPNPRCRREGDNGSRATRACFEACGTGPCRTPT